MTEFWESGLILRTLSGSRAQGLDRKGSDTDTRGVCIPPVRFLLGLERFEQHESAGGDHVTYALDKFTRLALNGNPNILESLFADPRDVLHMTPAGERLVTARKQFLSKRLGPRYLGYAQGQLKRLRGHHRWLTDPPREEPDPLAFGMQTVDGRQRFPNADNQRAFEAAHKQWQHYNTWRAERNPARAELEEHHGYDTKHAMHLIRLLKMGVEVLRDGQLLVKRPDADELLSIRDGALSFDAMLERTEALEAQLLANLKTSPLPDEPDSQAVEQLLIDLQIDALMERPQGSR